MIVLNHITIGGAGIEVAAVAEFSKGILQLIEGHRLGAAREPYHQNERSNDELCSDGKKGSHFLNGFL
ncbi:MAG: hypothetical protein WAP74_03025 [Patescibacteria group bacterium]